MSSGVAQGRPKGARPYLKGKNPPELTIDQWFARQDEGVEGAFRVLKRNSGRRKTINIDELERRVAQRVLRAAEDAATEIAIARAVYRKYGLGAFSGELNESLEEGYERRYPGKTINEHPITPWRIIDPAGETYRPWNDPIRREVENEMAAEMDEAQRQLALRRLPRALYPDDGRPAR